jgi:glycosyltransferase involved in cell wall biosynthesis
LDITKKTLEANGMKILNISSSAGIGGREMLVMTLSESLRAKNCEVRLITAKNTWLDKKANENNFVNYNLPMKKYVDLYSIFKIGKILKEFKPDVVHIYFITDIWLVVPAVKLFYPKAKIFLLRSMQSANMRDLARTILFNALAKVIVMSDFLKYDFLSKTRLKNNKVETIYIGVDLEKFNNTSTNENVLKKDYNLKDDAIIVGLVGRIDTGKGQDKFISAIKNIVDKLKLQNSTILDKLNFFIVGSSEKGAGIDYENKLKQTVENFGLADNVIFTGFRNDIPAVMNSLDIAVFPSKDEAFGLVVIEAMAMKKAVVGFNRGAFPEIILNNENGLIVEYDSALLAEGILELILDKDKRKLFGENGRKLVETKFNLETTIEKFLEMYSSEL